MTRHECRYRQGTVQLTDGYLMVRRYDDGQAEITVKVADVPPLVTRLPADHAAELAWVFSEGPDIVPEVAWESGGLVIRVPGVAIDGMRT